MMPGDSHAKTVAIAADATVGNCQNCSVLQQTLAEYVSSLLTLKQKITVSDDTIALQQQLEELQLQLVTLQTKTADYESLQAELEEKKKALKDYEQLSKEVEELKQENSKITVENKELGVQLKCAKEVSEAQTLETAQIKREKAVVENDLLQTQASLKKCQIQADQVEMLTKENSKMATMNKELGDQLKCAEEGSEAQTLETAQIKREKAVVENDLLQTQAFLKKCQIQADQVEVLTKENSKMTTIKNSLEKKVEVLEDLISKQNRQISQLTKEKNQQDRNIDDLQMRLMRLERERIKEYRSTSTQASMPAEPKVDKERFRLLLEDLWVCVEPEQPETSKRLHFGESGCQRVRPPSPQDRRNAHHISKSASPKSSMFVGDTQRTEATSAKFKSPPKAQIGSKSQASPEQSSSKKKTNSPKKAKPMAWEDESQHGFVDYGSLELYVEEILQLFKPLPSCLSPLHDLDCRVEALEDDNRKWEKESKPARECLPPKQSEVLLSSQKSLITSEFPTKENIDLPVVSIQNGGQMFYEIDSKNSRQNVVDAVIRKEVPKNAANGKLHHQNTRLTEKGPPFAPPSSSLSDNPVSVADVSSPTGRQNHNGTSEMETGNSSVETTGQSQIVTTLNVKQTPPKIADARTVLPGDVGSSQESDATLTSREAKYALLVTCSTLTDPVGNTKVQNTEASHGTSAERSKENTGCLGQGSDCEIPEASPFSSCISDTVGFPSNKIVEGTLEIDTSTEVVAMEDCISEQETEEVEVDKRTMSSAKLKEQDDVKIPSETDIIETTPSHGPSLSDCQETQTVKSTSKDKTHSPDRGLSLEPHLSSEKSNADVNEHYISTNKKPSVPNSEENGTTERAIVKDFPQDPIDSGSTASFIHNAATTQGQSNCLEPLPQVCEKQSPGPTGEKIANPNAKSTTAESTKRIAHVRSEVGPPLPPLLTPVVTPPKAEMSIYPRQAIGKLLFPSPMTTLASPTTPTQALLTPNSQPHSVPSSPLQFGSATPKHAVPVPGRLPLTAINSSPSSSSSPSQENSVRILDSMYPDLSARARTLSILRGNVSLSVCPSENESLPAAADSQTSSFKTLNSTPTAFTKAEQRGEKRPAIIDPPQPASKYLKVDSSSVGVPPQLSPSSRSGKETSPPRIPNPEQSDKISVEIEKPAERNLLADSFKKIEKECFDLLPVLRSHLHVGNLPKKPVLRGEEREVISEICLSNSLAADDMLLAISNKMKAEKQQLSGNHMQALCRVYTGICRQKRYQEKARILAYSILTEDFPNCAQLVLFMVTTWPTVLSHSSSLCQAIHTVTKLKAPEDLRHCLSAFLGWGKNPPSDIDHLITRTMSEIRSGSNMSFTKHSRYGDDLAPQAWEHVFTLHLLCSHKQWKWTYENFLGKELWPLMDSWVTQPRDQQQPVSDATVAAVLRLIGRLGQLGLKQKSVSSVSTVASVINTFGRNGHSEGVPFEVQLAAIYCMYDLSPCSPKEALDAVAGWRGEQSQSVPPAVTSYINQLASICRQVKH